MYDAPVVGLDDYLGGDARAALLEALFEHAPVILQIFDVDGHPIVANPWMNKVMGRGPPPEYSVFRDEILIRQGVQPLIRRAFAGEVVTIPPAWHDPRYLEHVDGSGTNPIAIEVTLVPVRDRAGAVTHVLAFARDARPELELRAREDRLRIALGAARMIAIDASLTTRALQISDDCAEVLGLAGGAPATLEELAALIHPDDRDAFVASTAPVVGAATEQQFRIIRPRDGETRWLEQRSRVDRDDVSGQPWLHGILMDVTERVSLRDAEDQLRRAQKLEAIGRMAGGIAHDFNNMLTVILCYAGILSRDGRGRGLDAAIDAIQRAGTQAADLTRQLLAFSSQQMMSPRLLDLSASVTESARMVERLLGDDIELVVRAGAGASVRADAGQIAQIVTNLMLNARDAMPRGGTLTIAVELVPGFVKLSVTDTGVGMDEETRRRVFEPFFTTRAHGRGVGLGLASVFGIVQQCGGSIDLRSHPGEGTTFEILLPHVAGPAIEGAISITAEPRVEPVGHETVLVVDDQEAVRRAVRETLERCGYHVLVATNAGEALLLCERHERPIHLLLSDVVMPHVSGPELAQRVAPLRPEMKVLLMSGYTDGQPDVGAYPYIQKPLVPDVLARRIGELLR